MYHAAPGSAFSAIGALVVTFVSWASFLVLGAAIFMADIDLMIAILAGQLVMLLVPAIAARITARNARALGLARPRARYVLAALLVGSSMWLVNLALVDLLSLPDDEGTLKAAIDKPGLALVLLVIVLAPAICEEVLFRGVLLRGFASQLHGWAAIILSSLLFSIYHLNLPQMVPTFLLGLVLALIAMRGGSAIPTMIAHALNNGIAVLLVRGELAWLANAIERQPVIAVGCACALAIGGVALAATGERSA